MNSDTYKKSAELLTNADSILIAAGAGIGVDSGLPNFRGNQGFWKAYPPMKKLGLSFSEMANPQWFSLKPKLAWGFYGHRLNLYRSIEPHSGFKLLLDYANTRNEKYFVFTSNVDGQFQKAGFDEDRIVECHGSIHYCQCHAGCNDKIWHAKDTELIVDENTLETKNELPKCPDCGSLARPNVLMFGDWAWNRNRSYLQEKNFESWLNNINTSKLLIIEIGAGRTVATVRFKSESIFREFKCNLIRINPRDFDAPVGTIAIAENAKSGLEKIFLNI